MQNKLHTFQKLEFLKRFDVYQELSRRTGRISLVTKGPLQKNSRRLNIVAAKLPQSWLNNGFDLTFACIDVFSMKAHMMQWNGRKTAAFQTAAGKKSFE